MNWHWRNSMKPVRFFALDARSAFFVFVFLMHMRLKTLLLVIVSMILFYILERMGLTFESALRAIRRVLIGDRRPSILWLAKRKMIDNGGM